MVAVSIAMLTFNHGQFVESALQGVLGQRTNLDYELVVADDASTDNTLAVVDEYANAYSAIRVLSPEPNQGMHRNFARVLRACKGDFIALCDGDDYWTDESKLQLQYEIMLADPKISLSHTNFTNIVAQDHGWIARENASADHGAPRERSEDRDRILTRNYVQTCTVMLRRDVALGWLDSELSQAGYPFGDWPLYVYASRMGDFHFSRRSTAVYRTAAGSALNGTKSARSEIGVATLRMVDDFLRAQTSSISGPQRDDLQVLTRFVMRNAARAGDKAAVRFVHNWRQKHGLHSSWDDKCISTALGFRGVAELMDHLALRRQSIKARVAPASPRPAGRWSSGTVA